MAAWGGEDRGCCSDTFPPPPRWANGYSEEKPLSVPRDTPFQLETCPLTAVDALGNSWVPNSPGPWLTPWWAWWGEHPGRAKLGAQLHAPRSPALLPGVPVVCGLRSVLGWRVPLHRGLLLCAGPGQGDQHRCVLVPAHHRLLYVSFLLAPQVGKVEACGSWTPGSLSPQKLSGVKQSLFYVFLGRGSAGLPHICSMWACLSAV